jgi:hypothetical protein
MNLSRDNRFTGAWRAGAPVIAHLVSALLHLVTGTGAASPRRIRLQEERPFDGLRANGMCCDGEV